MEVQLFKLSKQSDKKLLVDFLNETPNDKIVDTIKAKLNDLHATNDIDTVFLLRSILVGSPVEGGQESLERRHLLLECIIEWLSVDSTDDIERSKQASSIVNLILPEIESLPSELLHAAGLKIIEVIKQSKQVHLRLLDIFTKTWNALSAANEITELNDLFDGLINANWNIQSVVGICSAINEMELSDKQLEQCIKHMTKKLYDVDMDGVPPFIYQLLLISRKGHKKKILSGILEYFSQVANGNDDISAEGTAMLHISFAIKQDQDLGNELVKIMKNSKMNQLDIFSIATLLSVARIHRLQDTVLDLLKSSIISAFKDNEKYLQYNWITKYSVSDSSKFSSVLLEIADKSTSGWDQVIQSLTQLSFVLIDTVSSQGSFFASNSIRSRTSGEVSNANSNVANLAIAILARLFKYHDIVRSEILEQITSRIVTRSSSASDFIKLLEIIIREHPHTVEKYLNMLKDTLDLLSFLPLTTAERLLNAIRPISKSNQQFRDGLILVLRKSLFAKDIDGREIAVRGFLNILDDQLSELKVNENSAQAEGIVFEILGLLRRCFSQQSEIRTGAYNCLGTLSQEYTAFAGDVFEMLLTQFMRSYEKNTSILCPVKLDLCVENTSSMGQVKIIEPIHILLLNTLRSMNAAGKHPETSSLVAENMARFKGYVKSLVLRLSNAALEDFELDKVASFDPATLVGQKNTQHASLLLSLYEISIEHEYSSNEIEADSSEIILNLFKRRKELLGLLSFTPDKGKKALSMYRPITDLTFAVRIFKKLFADENSMSEPLRNLRSNIDFVHFVVASTGDSLKFAINDPYSHQDDEYFSRCADICQIHLRILSIEDSDSILANNQSAKKGPSVLTSVCNYLLSILEIVCNVWPDRFIEFLICVLQLSNDLTQKNKIIVHLIDSLKEITLKFLSGRSPIYKEVSNVIQVITFLARTLDKTDDDFCQRTQRIVSWVNELAKDRPIEDTGLAKELVSLLIHMSANAGEHHIIQSLCEDLHAYAGEVESGFSQEDESEQLSIQYQIISNKTFGVITSQVFDYLDASFDEITWSIGKLRLFASESIEEDVQSFEQEVCQYLVLRMKILNELVRTVLTDASAESLFKTLVRFYKALHVLVKYKLAFPGDVSQSFINVISMSGSDITDKMYKFLTVYGQRQQIIESSRIKTKNKGKKRKEIDTKQEARVQRESRMIPQLIYTVEQYERHLIQLSRKTKVDFMQYMKRSTSRDFKIEISMLNAESSSDEDEKESVENSIEHSSKRTRII
ncbi:hypothetical protein G6F64_005845 [Rhizopus arrhizus]|uniref:Fanconi anemia group I protein n=1 Tax=Rhizopus oryzae TaxID=64495 RepID=A0A9P7BT04_RHIOR|nr:hypothetical protein G6F64_005845 [Rhizopus arrhizus]